MSRKVKVIFYKDKWREVKMKMLGGREVPKDSRRRLVASYVMYKGRPRTLSDDILNTFKIKYI